MPNPDLIRLENIGLKFGKLEVLNQINLSLHRDCITTLIGPNGAGKSSLVKVLLQLQAPSSGKVWHKPGLRIGYMPQKLHVDRTLPLTVKRFMNLPYSHKIDQVKSALDSVGATHLIGASLHDLSGGETQRVLLARALLREPELLVLDEPVQGVDINGQTELYQLISDIRKERQCSVLMVSHDLHLVMASTDHVICLNKHICCAGHPELVTAHPEYFALFGPAHAATLALYNHHHNHSHSLDGGVVNQTEGQDCCGDEHG